MEEGCGVGVDRGIAVVLALSAMLAAWFGLPSAAAGAVGPTGVTVGRGPDRSAAHGVSDAGIEPYSRNPTETRPFALCPPPTERRASCMAAVVPVEDGEAVVKPELEGGGMLGGLSPASLRSAYGISGSAGAGQTIAITIAFDNPNAEEDLATYRSTYGLSPCTTANGCFRKVNQSGEEGSYPAPNEEWALETSLDLDMVSAICPECRILLVEADSNTVDDLAAAVETAAGLGATVISNSWAAYEFDGESGGNSAFRHPGVPTLFASGDWGYGVYYPAASPDVIAVGGTSLEKAQNARGWKETAWQGTGSGCSSYEAKPSWQHDTGCATRTLTDIAAVADTNTPVSVYDSFGAPGWTLLGGTSVATPVLAGVEAVSSPAARAGGPEAITRAGEAGLLNDVVEGENGICGSYLCQADDGFDGPTGWGTPRGPLSAPAAVTGAATMESPDEAVLRGAIDPSGVSTTYRFLYGKTTSYGASAPVPDAEAGSGSGYVEVEEAIDGLEPRTIYHYRLVATTATGTFRGEDRTFSTTPPSVETGLAGGIETLEATVHGEVDPERAATRYHFEYGLSTDYTSRAPVRAGRIAAGDDPVAVSVRLQPLQPGTVYHYRLVATNSAGTTNGPDRIFVTEAAQWFATVLPQPPNSGNGHETAGVSCVAATMCVAVGDNWSMDLHTEATLAEAWDGQEWKPMPTPNPPGLEEGWMDGRVASLREVDCAADGQCVAVGYYRDAEGLKPLVERLQDGVWTMISPPPPEGAVGAVLEGVSCVSTTDCVIVGNVRYVPNQLKPLILRWDGDGWTEEAAPGVPDPDVGWLTGVDCRESGSCMAVGARENAEGEERTFAARLENGSWSEQETEDPTGNQAENVLADVSCPGPDACIAVGAHYEVHGSDLIRYPLAEHWDGTGWVVQQVPFDQAGHTGLEAISCVAPNACTAVGQVNTQAPWGPTGGTLEYRMTEMAGRRWDGTAWTELPMIGLADPDGWWHDRWLLDVSCPEAEACTSVGFGFTAPLGLLSPSRALAEHEIPPPIARFIATPEGLESGDRVDFDASSTAGPKAIESYDWDFGDGSQGTGAKPSHVYGSPGQYMVVLEVVDESGREGRTAKVITVETSPPTADFSVRTPTPTVGEPTHFDGSASEDADGAIESYRWSFGDGTESEGPEVFHTFLEKGPYKVTLTVTDDGGRSAELERLVNVSDPPPRPRDPEVTPAAPQPPPIAGGPGDGPSFSVLAAEASHGRIVLRLAASDPGRFEVEARRSAPPRAGDAAGPTFLFGHASAPAGPAAVSRFVIAPSGRARRALRRNGRLRASVTMTLHADGGGEATKSLVLMVEAGSRSRKG
jgi:chitodextrinase